MMPLMIPKVMKRRISMPWSRERLSRTQDLRDRPWRRETYSVIRVSEEIAGVLGRKASKIVGALRAMFGAVFELAVDEEAIDALLR